MPSEPKRGDIRIEITNQGDSRPPEISYSGQDEPARFLWLLLMGVLAVPLLWIVISIATKEPSTAVSSGTVQPVILPSVIDLSVPKRPTCPGYKFTFELRSSSDKKGSAQDRLEPSLTLTYERLHIISVRDLKFIPTDIQRRAYTFPSDRQEVHAYADLRRPIQNSTFVETDKPKDILERLNQVVKEDTSDPVEEKQNRVRSEEQGPLTPYIIHGDVHITCGPLLDYDIGYADALVYDDLIARLKLRLIADQGPRGPPSTKYMLSLGGKTLERTVYVVGHIKEFKGPDQFHKSFMATRVVDLGPTKPQLEEFEKRDHDWQAETAKIAAQYGTSAKEVREYAGRKIDIRYGTVSKAPSPAERQKIEQRAMQEQHKMEEQFRREALERAERPRAVP